MTTWEYAEIQFTTTFAGDSAYVYMYRDGELKVLGGFKSSHKISEALHQLGKDRWELVSAVSGIGDLGGQTIRLFLKRPLA